METVMNKYYGITEPPQMKHCGMFSEWLSLLFSLPWQWWKKGAENVGLCSETQYLRRVNSRFSQQIKNLIFLSFFYQLFFNFWIVFWTRVSFLVSLHIFSTFFLSFHLKGMPIHEAALRTCTLYSQIWGLMICRHVRRADGCWSHRRESSTTHQQRQQEGFSCRSSS